MAIYAQIESLGDSFKRSINMYRRYSYWSTKQCIFIHIPKAAGTSINRAIYGRTLGHYRAIDVRRKFPKLFEKCFVFTFIRNPWDRVFSAYRFARMGRTNLMGIRNSSQYQIPEFESFEKFLCEWLVFQKVEELDFVFRPQVDFIVDSQGVDLVEYVGRVESITSDFNTVSSRLNISLDLLHDNSTGSKEDFRDAYTNNAMIDIVGRIYHQDISHFEYTF